MTHLVDRATATRLTKEIDDAVSAILERNGFSKPKISTTYGEFYKVAITTSLETLDENGVNLTSKEALDYQANYALYALRPDVLGVEFLMRGEKYVFVGTSARSSKYPILAKRLSDGVTMKMSDHAVTLINAAVEHPIAGKK